MSRKEEIVCHFFQGRQLCGLANDEVNMSGPMGVHAHISIQLCLGCFDFGPLLLRFVNVKAKFN